MSSLRNAVKRRTHKERSQPGDRNRLGLLEKHKDYVLRAKDFHKKEKTIQVLKEKASFKNPDEFYYKMINTRMVDGVHRPKGGKVYTHEEISLMKTQDVRYVALKAQTENKKVERLRSVLHSIEKPLTNTHTYFAENRLEVKEVIQNIVDKPQRTKGIPRAIKTQQKAAYRELEERSKRAETMKSMLIDMTLQKQIMGKGRKRKLSSDEVESAIGKPVFKWRPDRKK